LKYFENPINGKVFSDTKLLMFLERNELIKVLSPV